MKSLPALPTPFREGKGLCDGVLGPRRRKVPPLDSSCFCHSPTVPREPGEKPVHGGTGLGTPWEEPGGPPGPRSTGPGPSRGAEWLPVGGGPAPGPRTAPAHTAMTGHAGRDSAPAAPREPTARPQTAHLCSVHSCSYESQGHLTRGSGGQGPECDSSHTWGELRLQGDQATGYGDVGFEPRPYPDPALRGQTAGHRQPSEAARRLGLTCLLFVVSICKADLMHGLAALDL